MPIYRRLPKKGFSNARFQMRYDVVNIGQLVCFDAGSKVDLKLLEEKGILKPRHGRLKVLGDGEISVSLEVVAAKVSKKAQEKIVQAGGNRMHIAGLPVVILHHVAETSV